MGDQDELLAAVQARLEEITTTGNLSLALEPDAAVEARRLAGTLSKDTEDDLEARSALGWLHWVRYQARGRGRRDLERPIWTLRSKTAGPP